MLFSIIRAFIRAFLATGFPVLFVLAALNSQAGEETDPISLKIGSTNVHIVLGDIVLEQADALVVSHWPGSVNDDGGVGGAIARSGGKSALAAFGTILKSQGHLPYTQVYPTPLDLSGKIKARHLFNVIELKPAHRLSFNTLDELNASSFPFSARERTQYQKLLTEYQIEIAEQLKAENDAIEKVKAKTGDAEAWKEFIRISYSGKSARYARTRETLFEPYLKTIGYETVVETIAHVFEKAHAMGDIATISVPTLGYGIMGDLTMPESVSAILSGVKLYSMRFPAESRVKDFRIVLYSRDTPKNRAVAKKQLGALIRKGNFLKQAEKQLPHWKDRFDWKQAKVDFVKNESASLRFSGSAVSRSLFEILENICRGLLGG